jgi:hypothetical protein
MGTTYSTYSMASALTRAHAVASLESMGYSCSLDENDGALLVDVDHKLEDAAMVRCLVLHVDPTARLMGR